MSTHTCAHRGTRRKPTTGVAVLVSAFAQAPPRPWRGRRGGVGRLRQSRRAGRRGPRVRDPAGSRGPTGRPIRSSPYLSRRARGLRPGFAGLQRRPNPGCPMSIVITAGQRGDYPQFEVVLGGIRVPRPGSGRPRTRPRRVRADKAYVSRKNRACLRRRGIRCTIPDKADQARNRRKKRLPRRPSAEVRPGGPQGSVRGRVRHQSSQKAPCRGHEVRQARGPLRGNRPDSSRQRVAVTSTSDAMPSPRRPAADEPLAQA